MPATPSAPDRAARDQALAELLACVKLGDRAAFSALYRQTGAHLFGIILRINGDRGQAEDVLQEVFVNLWRAASSYDAVRSSPFNWLVSVARHRAIDSLRRNSAQPRTVSHQRHDHDEDEQDMLSTIASDDAGPLERLGATAQAREVAACLQGLSHEQRQCLSLTFYQGLSHAEAAAHLAQPLGSVKSWVRRGLMALKACLSARGQMAA
ncbi:sigma-70 family RNA polymerase sigma factor [Piscinibacter sp.]|uniref:sigma-70 family RNA polymerase sigma factor n=1 Tax=Piscinibacter sp. TaxID=1903157 RepID=UPI002B55E909|nr:sigma-70 family RNA polymerase sigma factor [Albitalea sp.]HUG24265.1 sigma-70 family RNA polymerase sigma factor [Albitalea sp.]